MRKAGAAIIEELKRSIPAAIFFLVLFHLIGITKAVALGHMTFDALRASYVTVIALIVTKAILVVEALPFAHLAGRPLATQMAWKASLYTLVALIVRLLEEGLPLVVKQRSVPAGIRAMVEETSWAYFAVGTAWAVFGLAIYAFVSGLVEAIGADTVKRMLRAEPPVPRAP